MYLICDALVSVFVIVLVCVVIVALPSTERALGLSEYARSRFADCERKWTKKTRQKDNARQSGDTAAAAAAGGMKIGTKRKKEPKTNNHFYVINGQLLITYYTIFQVGLHFFCSSLFHIRSIFLSLSRLNVHVRRYRCLAKHVQIEPKARSCVHWANICSWQTRSHRWPIVALCECKYIIE